MINLSSVLRHHAERQPDKVALIFKDQRISYCVLNRGVEAVAKGFKDLGLERGDIVAVLLLNCPEFLQVAFAANRIGAIFLPLNYRLAAEEVAYILNHSGAKAIVTEKEFVSLLESVRSCFPDLKRNICIEGGGQEWTGYGDMVRANMGCVVPDTDVDSNDVHRIMYTSGTTARPKGAMITYGNLYWKNFSHIVELRIVNEDVGLAAGPLYHVGGLDLSVLHVLQVGGTVVILRKFDVSEVLRTVERERVTVVWLAPAMINMLLHEPTITEYDLSSVRVIIDGGEKMPLPLITKLLTTFPRAWLADAYGLTETASGDTFLSQERTVEKAGSVGKPVMFLELRVVDENDREAPRGQLGEIVLKGPKVFKGYWKDPEATADAFKGGWFHTGDIGKLDADGFLYIVDRKKDVIISGGENISPSEIERVLYEHPKVLEAAVIGVPDPRWNEAPKAFVVLKKGMTATPQELEEFCKAKLAKFKIPKQIEFIEALPRNPSGKVLKRLLREHQKLI